MKGKVKFAVIAVLFVFMVVAAAASSALAAEMIFQNTLDNRVYRRAIPECTSAPLKRPKLFSS